MSQYKSFSGFLFSFVQPAFLCLALAKHILREGLNNHKKRGVTTMIRFVSLPFYENKHLDRQEYEQKNCRIRLGAYDKEESGNRVA